MGMLKRRDTPWRVRRNPPGVSPCAQASFNTRIPTSLSADAYSRAPRLWAANV